MQRLQLIFFDFNNKYRLCSHENLPTPIYNKSNAKNQMRHVFKCIRTKKERKKDIHIILYSIALKNVEIVNCW